MATHPSDDILRQAKLLQDREFEAGRVYTDCLPSPFGDTSVRLGCAAIGENSRSSCGHDCRSSMRKVPVRPRSGRPLRTDMSRFRTYYYRCGAG
jgi:hypothetical protein